MSGPADEIADEFFEKKDVTAVDFEITIAALFGTAVLTFQVEGHAVFGQTVAFVLLILTLIRRMAITSPFAPEQKILRHTTPLISVISASAIIYLTAVMSLTLHTHVPNLSPNSIFSTVSITLIIGSVVVQEFVFRDYLIWWFAKFEQKSEHSELFGEIWKECAYLAYWASQARPHRDSYREISNRLSGSRPDLSKIDFEYRDVGRQLFVILFVFLILYIIPLAFSAYLFGVIGVLMLPAVVIVHDQAAFWYIAHGIPSFEDFRQRVPIIILRTGLYLTAVWYLIYPHQITLPFR